MDSMTKKHLAGSNISRSKLYNVGTEVSCLPALLQIRVFLRPRFCACSSHSARARRRLVPRLWGLGTRLRPPLLIGGRARVTCVHMRCAVSYFSLQLQELSALQFSLQVSDLTLVRAPTSDLSLAQGNQVSVVTPYHTPIIFVFYRSYSARGMASNCKLRLVQFCEAGGGRRRIGVEQGNGGSVVDMTAVDPSIPSDMKSFIEAWDTSTAAAAKSV